MDTVYYSGITALMMALACKDNETVQELQKAGAAMPDMRPRCESFSCAFESADLTDVVRHLAAGASPDTQLTHQQGVQGTRWGTPLMACAAMRRHHSSLAVAQLLVTLKADLAKGDAEGDNAVAHALYHGAAEIHMLLSSAGGQR